MTIAVDLGCKATKTNKQIPCFMPVLHSYAGWRSGGAKMLSKFYFLRLGHPTSLVYSRRQPFV